MCSYAEAKAASPGQADEVRSLNAQLIDYRDGICHPEVHCVSLLIVRLIARSEASVVDIDQPELILNRLGDPRASYRLDGV
jgi:hypothetical protein